MEPNRFDVEDLLDRFESFGTTTCLIQDDKHSTYNDLLEAREQRLAAWSHCKINQGDVLALTADFSLDAFACMLAAWSKKMIVALMPQDSGKRVIYLEATLASWTMDLDGSSPSVPVWLGEQRPHENINYLRDGSEPGFVIFTSGSSGESKAAVHQTSRFLSKFSKPGKPFRTISFLLFDHIAGIDTAFYTLSAGGTLVIPSRRDPDTICKLIAEHSAEVLPASPSFLRLMLLAKAHRKYDLSSLKVVTYGSEPMDEPTLSRLAEELPVPRIVQKYGTSEFGAPRAMSRDRNSCWINLKTDEIEYKIVDKVLWVRTATTMLGYLNYPSLFDDDGWLCTGDLVEQDGEWIKILGRQSDIINVGGEKVLPSEIEAIISELEYVAEVIVYGEQHTLLGQIVCAKVKLNPMDIVGDAEKRIRRHCIENLPRYMAPVKIDIVSKALHNARQKKARNIATGTN